jgi:hypothetical protein
VLRADGGDGPAPQPVPGTGAENSGPPTGANRLPIPGNDRLAARMARAERYLDDHLKKQRQWYSEKASAHRNWSQRLGLAVIACGALVTFVQVFAGTLPLVIPAVTAALVGTAMSVSIVWASRRRRATPPSMSPPGIGLEGEARQPYSHPWRIRPLLQQEGLSKFRIRRPFYRPVHNIRA